MNGEQRELRRKAYLAVRRALRNGTLVRQPCEMCSDPFSHAHHRWGYVDPLRVVWLCAYHHEEEHGQMRAAQPRRFYREPRHWQYSETTGPKPAIAHIERLFGLLNDHERRQMFRRLVELMGESAA
jgi:hypothetical protein